MTGIRRAGPEDAEAVVALREVMLTAIAAPPVGAEESWRKHAVPWFRERLASSEAAAFVAETAGGELVAAAFGEVRAHAPSPANPRGVAGHLSNVVALPEYRRRGLARGCVEAVLEWFRRETAVANVDLAATEAGRPLYEDLGFAVRPYPTMRVRL